MNALAALALGLALAADPSPACPPPPACPPCPAKPPAPPPKVWIGSAGLGFLAVTGNARSVTPP